jgi:D-amino peptidase
MKIFISCDMEGISGITGPDDADPRKEPYKRFQKVMTGDVNAAVEGATLAGADEIVVNDSHDGMRNILIEELSPKAQLISGFTKPLCMMQGIDSSFDLAVFVGYHARAGTAAAVMNHTIFGKEISDVWINDVLVGETGINAGIAGYFGVPVGAVTGDDKVCREATALLGNIETAAVKEGVDRYVAKCLPLEKSRELIKNAVKRAVERRSEFKPLRYQSPTRFKVRFASTTEAAIACLLPIVTMEDSRTVSISSNDYLEAFSTFLGVLMLASTASNETFG